MSGTLFTRNVVATAITPSVQALSAHDPRHAANIPYTLIACINQHNELLMVHRTKPPFVGCWNFIGGKIDLGESPTSAAIREVHEEAGRSVTQKGFSFRGVALWPSASDSEQYLGMFLYRFRCKTSNIEARQLSLIHEGVTSWINIDLLKIRQEFKPVPNFELILSCLLDVKRAPQVICHEVTDLGTQVFWKKEMPRENQKIAASQHSSLVFGLEELVGTFIGL